MQFLVDNNIFLNNLRWQELVDIAILSLIIYKIILMLQGTRTVQIMIGFLFVGGTSYLADFLGLAGVSWVLTNIFNSIVIVIIVLFQSDFRNALAQVGTKPFFRDSKQDKSISTVEKIYKLCEHFSQVRVGALIVLEREVGLRDYYTGATRLNAEFSPQLLVALFNPQAPLHDGAVVINKSMQVGYAGCILPLSSHHDFSKNLGTRHRAALGLSEETDAVVIVVSEETGEISMAHNGELYRKNNGTSVKNKFLSLFQ
ncbi:MAG: TIGR00159 family protein [SAR324 cluster bacterium]|uniref:Diadenylate cyclase n=1 Tax=SAR324 cluster bacterium TaxID=2024889 RepID=A0A2A4SUS1_9DELT|nr:MAG: TIGR00159 family protein [SAR324 cluster bacterium]